MLQKNHEFKIGKTNYRCIRLNAKTQFHILRRVLPLFSGLIADGVTFDESIKDSLRNVDISVLVNKILNSVGNIKGEDWDYILSQCLHSVSKEDAPGAFQSILTSDGAFLYEDIQYDLVLMMKIMSEVLQFNFKDFFTELPSSLPNPQ